MRRIRPVAGVVRKKMSVWSAKRVVDWERRARRTMDQPRRAMVLAVVMMMDSAMVMKVSVIAA